MNAKQIGLALVLPFLFSQATQAAEALDAPKSERDRISYSVGLEMARNFHKNEIEVDPAMVMRGLQDGLSGVPAAIGEKEFKKLLNNFQNVMRARTVATHHGLALANLQKGERFLKENKMREGVLTLPNGVQYKAIKSGNGVRANSGDIVAINWRGTNLDGQEYDSSEPGKPMRVPVNELFNGFRSAVTLMQEGSRWQIWIPSTMAYGDRGVGTELGPNETLVLDVELVAVQARLAGKS